MYYPISLSNFQKVAQLVKLELPGSGVSTRRQVIPRCGSVASVELAQMMPGNEIALQT